MIDILKNNELTQKLQTIREMYSIESTQHHTLDNFFNSIGEIDEWKYSTGPVFDQPPYSLEMAGFDGGRILKKNYPSPYEARLRGTYSSGFINQNHVITIYPSKPLSMPLQANFYRQEENRLITHSIISQKAVDPKSNKSPKLLGMGEIFILRDNIRAYVGVGKGDAYVIKLFYYDSDLKITNASMTTPPITMQNDFEFEYDDTNTLKSIYCKGLIWERRNIS